MEVESYNSEGKPERFLTERDVMLSPEVQRLYECFFDFDHPQHEAMESAFVRAQAEHPDWIKYNAWHYLVGSSMEGGRLADSSDGAVTRFARELVEQLKL